MVPPSISVVSLYPMVVADFLDHRVCDRWMMFCPFDKLSLIRSFCPICMHCLMAVLVGLSISIYLYPLMIDQLHLTSHTSHRSFYPFSLNMPIFHIHGFICFIIIIISSSSFCLYPNFTSVPLSHFLMHAHIKMLNFNSCENICFIFYVLSLSIPF